MLSLSELQEVGEWFLRAARTGKLVWFCQTKCFSSFAVFNGEGISSEDGGVRHAGMTRVVDIDEVINSENHRNPQIMAKETLIITWKSLQWRKTTASRCEA